jgi:hypothetical protein
MMHDCDCRFPKPGPLYWNFRCLKCSGVIRFKWFRWFRR